MTKGGRRKITTLIKDVAHLCDVPCITVKHCSSQEIATIALIITPLAVFDDNGSPSSLSFFRGKEVLVIVSQGLYSYSPADGTKTLDTRKVQALLHALRPPRPSPELPLISSESHYSSSLRRTTQFDNRLRAWTGPSHDD